MVLLHSGVFVFVITRLCFNLVKFNFKVLDFCADASLTIYSLVYLCSCRPFVSHGNGKTQLSTFGINTDKNKSTECQINAKNTFRFWRLRRITAVFR